MTRDELLQEIHKHLPVLANEGCQIRELKEIAPGIMVAFDESDGTFIYYFETSIYGFRTDRNAQMWGANDQSGQPEGCSEGIHAFVCGINSPDNWSDVVFEAKNRLITKEGEYINWHKKPVEISLQ